VISFEENSPVLTFSLIAWMRRSPYQVTMGPESLQVPQTTGMVRPSPIVGNWKSPRLDGVGLSNCGFGRRTSYRTVPTM